MGDDKTVGPSPSDHSNVVAEQFVLEFQTPQVFHGRGVLDTKEAATVEHWHQAIRMLVLFHPPPTKADGMLGALRIKAAWIRKGRQLVGCGDHLPSGFRDAGPVIFEMRRSFGVWAKNSTRDITG